MCDKELMDEVSRICNNYLATSQLNKQMKKYCH